MKLKITLDNKVYEVDVEASEPEPEPLPPPEPEPTPPPLVAPPQAAKTKAAAERAERRVMLRVVRFMGWTGTTPARPARAFTTKGGPVETSAPVPQRQASGVQPHPAPPH